MKGIPATQLPNVDYLVQVSTPESMTEYAVYRGIKAGHHIFTPIYTEEGKPHVSIAVDEFEVKKNICSVDALVSAPVEYVNPELSKFLSYVKANERFLDDALALGLDIQLIEILSLTKMENSFRFCHEISRITYYLHEGKIYIRFNRSGNNNEYKARQFGISKSGEIIKLGKVDFSFFAGQIPRLHEDNWFSKEQGFNTLEEAVAQAQKLLEDNKVKKYALKEAVS